MEVTIKCPASMCPLIAPDGSPWTGEHDTDCTECCGWFFADRQQCIAGADLLVMLDREEPMLVIGPNQPNPKHKRAATFDCDREHECRWQQQAGDHLCPPRLALSKGLDPRVCCY